MGCLRLLKFLPEYFGFRAKTVQFKDRWNVYSKSPRLDGSKQWSFDIKTVSLTIWFHEDFATSRESD